MEAKLFGKKSDRKGRDNAPQRAAAGGSAGEAKFAPLFAGFGFGETVTFGEGGDGLQYLRDGWSTPESWGVWSDGLFTSLSIPTSRLSAGRPVRLIFDARGFTTPGVPEQKATVIAGESELANWIWSGAPPSIDQNVKEVILPAAMLGRSVEFHFAIGAPTSPSGGGGSSDTRSLGIGLVSMRAEPA